LTWLVGVFVDGQGLYKCYAKMLARMVKENT